MDGARTEPAVAPARITPKERSERIARSLSEAARKLRFSSARAVYSPIGRKARRHRLISKLIVIGGFVGFVAIPALCAIVYFTFIAADQYQAEARFAVRSSAMAGVDTLGSLTGVPSAQIIQDTQLVTSYIGSRAMIEELQRTAGFREAYTTDKADWFTRLRKDETMEEVVKYWSWKFGTTIQLPGGLVVVTVRAFTPEDALRLTSAVLDASENLVNDLNERARQDAVRNATNDLKFAANRLAKARAALELARNREGILDTTGEREKADALLTVLRQRLIDLRQQYDSTIKSVSADAPQMRTLKVNMAATEKQIAEVQSELTRTSNQSATSKVLSGSMTRLSILELESQVADQQYTSAATALEQARSASLTKQIYLTTFVRPALAEEGRYPRRAWWTFLTVAAGFALWGAFCGVAVAVRGYL
jgi:capsular polysaccharide transport system permease protein